MKRIAHPSLDERRARGLEARERTPLPSHRKWRPAADREDPVAILERQNATREPDLVPVRHGRMLASPFTFFRGAAAVMAADLVGSPVAGLGAQLCGDAHLSNFGLYASPERRLLFDVNDFDETLPGPFEYDVKRLAASFAIAARHNGFSKPDVRVATLAAVTSYRESMAQFAEMPTMDVWYARMDEDELMQAVHATADATAKAARSKKQKQAAKSVQKAAKAAEEAREKARSRTSLQALSKLGELVDGRYRIASRPPIVVPFRELGPTYGLSTDQLEAAIREQFRVYRATLQDDRRHLLERFQIIDVARNVVGIGSVGTRAYIVLLQGRDLHDPLFLQVKEATASVLEASLGRSRYKQPGARVVQGQRLMQASSDIYLGWAKGAEPGRYFYWRQLRDMKGSAVIDSMAPGPLRFYARICGWTLARAHARSGDQVAIATYLGDTDAFDRSMADFAERYADQNERDYKAFAKAVRSGRLAAIEGL
jgi:uncharacterized protein (DUF2252 family)